MAELDSSVPVNIGTIQSTTVNVSRTAGTTNLNSGTININEGTMYFFDTSGDGNYIGLVAPASQTESQIYVLPDAASLSAANMLLTTTTGGVTSWTPNAFLTANQIGFGSTPGNYMMSDPSLTYVNPTLFAPGISLATTGGTAAVLNYYEAHYTQSLTFSAPWAANQTVTVNLTRLGNTVHMYIPGFSAAATSTTLITSTTSLPARFVPSTTNLATCIVVNNIVNVTGQVLVSGAGVVTLNTTAGGFTASGGAGGQLPADLSAGLNGSTSRYAPVGGRQPIFRPAQGRARAGRGPGAGRARPGHEQRAEAGANGAASKEPTKRE